MHTTAYEMRISDWSSYVCSSDLLVDRAPHREGIPGFAHRPRDIGDHRLAGRAHRGEIVPGVVERGSREIVHRRIADHLGMDTAGFHPDPPRPRHAGIAPDHAPESDHQLDATGRVLCGERG